jgi:hypothetical protein
VVRDSAGEDGDASGTTDCDSDEGTNVDGDSRDDDITGNTAGVDRMVPQVIVTW